MTPEDLVELEEIKAVKYRYVRGVDLRDWDLVASTLTEDATAAYSSGKLSFDGREAILTFLRESMPPGEMLSAHQVSQPEIDLRGDSAVARWRLNDVVILPAANIAIRGAAYYEDEMTKVGGEWKIRHTGYRRLYEETSPREGMTLTDHWWAQDSNPPKPPR